MSIHNKLAGFLGFALWLFYNLYHHQMWFDELQAWSLTRASTNPFHLFMNLSSEGHPMLWYLLLWWPGRWTADPLAMQVVTFTLGLANLWLLWFRAPFTNREKLLLSVSYQWGFNFLVISRCYVLGLFLVLLFVSFPKFYDRHAWVGWSLLGLMANVHLYFTVSSFCLALAWLHYQSPERRRGLLSGASCYLFGFFFAALSMLRVLNRDGSSFTHLPYVVIATLGMAAALWLYTLSPEKTMVAISVACVLIAVLVLLKVAYSKGFEAGRIPKDLSTLGVGLIPLKHPLVLHYWNPRLSQLLGSAVFLVASFTVYFLFRRHYLLITALGLQAVFMLLVFHMRHPGESWHVGVLFTSLLAYVWWARSKNLVLGPAWLLLVFLIPQAIAGTNAKITSKNLVLSNARQTADWLAEHQGETDALVGYPMFPTIGVAAYLEQPLYFPSFDDGTLHIVWGHWVPNKFLAAVLAKRMRRDGLSSAYLVVPSGCRGPTQKSLESTPELSWRWVAGFEDAILENYLIYYLRLNTESETS